MWRARFASAWIDKDSMVSEDAFFEVPLRRIAVGDIALAARVAGQGPALLLLHGHPQTQAIWHRLWPALTRRFTCVAADLRGYGDSDKPAASPDHGAHAKRVMAADMLALMQALGLPRFSVLAHDRGARVAHRLGLDHPEHVQRMMLLDIAPTLDMYEGTTRAFAQAYYHWFWLIQPAPLPETMIARDPAFYVRGVMGGRPGGLAHFAPRALAEYERCARLPAGQPASARTTAPRPRSIWSMTARRARPASASPCPCACCGANAARSDAISMSWGFGARWPPRSMAGPSTRPIICPRRRPARCWKRRWPSWPAGNRRPPIGLCKKGRRPGAKLAPMSSREDPIEPAASGAFAASDSPCVAVCSTLFDDICRGCGRTAMEVANWVFMSDDEKREVWARIRAQGYPRRNS